MIFSVSEANNFIKALLDAVPQLQTIFVRGEISNYKLYPSGHHYFTLKDEGSALKCVMFRGMAAKLDLSPVYLSNIENDRRPAPTRAYLERLEQELHLNKAETEQMLDLAAKSQNNRVSADLPDYIMDREIVRAALRTAKEADATDQEWQEFIDRITQRAKKSKEGGEIDA